MTARGIVLKKLMVGMLLSLACTAQAVEYVEGLDEWPVMSLQQAVQRGLEQNFTLQAASLDPAVARRDVTVEEARFDADLNAAVSAAANRQPDTLLFQEGSGKKYAGEAGVGKKFHAGLDASLALKTTRSTGNTGQTVRSPEYGTALVLDLTQPLLRDLGRSVNTADIRKAGIGQRQAALGYLDQAQRLAEAIETGYYDLSQAIEVYNYRIESRELARELVEGNREKLEVGIIPISEVHEAETAVAGRDELVLLARQQVESVGNRLKGLLGIIQEYPLSRNFYRSEELPEAVLPVPELEAALGRALEDRPDLESRRLEVESNQIRLEFDRNQLLPRLDLQATLSVNGVSGDDGNLAGNVSHRDYFDSVDHTAGADGYQWFAGLKFSYPIGNRSAVARYEQARLLKRRAILSVKALETTVETEVINSLILAKRSLERVKVAQRFNELADRTMRQEMERLAEGLSNTFRVLDFQERLIDARIRKVTALADFNKGMASMARATGANLERFDITPILPDEEILHDK